MIIFELGHLFFDLFSIFKLSFLEQLVALLEEYYHFSVIE